MGPTQRFRHSSAITVAAVIAMIAGLSLATWAPYLLPLLVVPLAVAVWTWRAGTEADAGGLTVRAAFGSRRIPWSAVSGLVTDNRGRVRAQLASGKALHLTAVAPADVPRLVAASGQYVPPKQDAAPEQEAPLKQDDALKRDDAAPSTTDEPTTDDGNPLRRT